MKTIIIGGVAAGMSAATRLRRLQEDADITVYEMGENVSYANCGLPYFISDTISDRAALLLQTPESLHSRFRLDVKTGHKVVAIDKDAKSVTVQNLETGETFEDYYDSLVLATGAKPRKLNIPGIERALTLRDVEDADRLKAAALTSKTKTAVIIGGGFIGIETAENLVHSGFQVHLVQRGPQLLGLVAPEIVEVMQKHLEANSIKLHLRADLTEITESTVTVNGTPIVTDLVISAAGVEPDNQLAKDAGLKFGETGGLWVDAQQRTSDPNIYAAGDAVEKSDHFTGGETLVPLANLANRHGRLIADAIAGLPVKVANTISTAIIGAFGMALATTGLSPAKAKAQGIAHEVIHLHPGSHAGYYPGAKRISMLVVFEPETGKLLGAQAVGEDGVDKRIDVIATAIFGGLTVNDLMDLELSYSPQYGSAKDPINHAGYVGNNVLTGRTPTFQWHELEAELAKPNTVLVDVRTPSENQAGTTPNSINISVDELRDHIDELRGKRVLVHCQVGQRGHTATQILRGHGIEALNLDGGYLTWRAGHDSRERA
jgi:NADPH-dependent 2,4-dienoyl-CoA reductase/sulfur reductase-like enzyme/rhodanese-related sulfurtransferase